MVNNLQIGLKVCIAYLLEKNLKLVLYLLGLMKKVELFLFIEVLLFVEDAI